MLLYHNVPLFPGLKKLCFLAWRKQEFFDTKSFLLSSLNPSTANAQGPINLSQRFVTAQTIPRQHQPIKHAQHRPQSPIHARPLQGQGH